MAKIHTTKVMKHTFYRNLRQALCAQHCACNTLPLRATIRQALFTVHRSLFTVLCTLLTLHCSLFTAQAQPATTYPVQVNTHLVPPYSLYLDDYANGIRERISVTLINRDLQYPSMVVQLRMTIKGNGFTLQTNNYATIAPITLEPNVPYRLSQEELAPLFNPQNLIANGLGTSGYTKDGRLPEGMLEFCFETVEKNTGRVVSLKGCGTAWITVQKPPLLSLPVMNETVPYRDPLNLLFQWTPRHNGLADVDYQLIIKQIWDNGLRPEAAFAYSPEIYRATVKSTSFLYGAAMPPLLPGMRYAWAAQAVAKDGMSSIRVFENDGLSEIWWFQLAEHCPPPLNVVARAENNRIVITWTPLPEHLDFAVSYREKDKPGAEWFTTKTLVPSVALYDVRPGYSYEYRIGTSCTPNNPIFGDIAFIHLPPVDTTRDALCGVLPALNLSNKEPLAALVVGEQFMAGDFPVFVTAVSGANGTFTGEGYTIVPFLASARLAVKFTGIGINTDRRLIRGVVESVYDATEGQLANLDDIFEGGALFGKVKQGITVVDYRVDFNITDSSIFTYNPQDGTVTVTDGNNTLGSFPLNGGASSAAGGSEAGGSGTPDFPITVESKDGTIYQVDQDPNDPTKLASTNIGKSGDPIPAGNVDYTQLAKAKAVVTFSQGEGARYAFDQWRSEYVGIKLIEPKYEQLDKEYYVPFKLLPPGKSDGVKARISIKDKTIAPEKVIFKTPKGTEFKATYNKADSGYTITLTGGASGDAQELYALYPNGAKYLNLGKLIVVSYPEQQYTAVAVAVSGATFDEVSLKKTLNDIYNPYGVSWTVEKVEVKTEDLTHNGNMDFFEKGSGLLSVYTPAMKEFQQAYQSKHEVSGKKAYLFFFEDNGRNKADRDASGFMPRNNQFAYLFTKKFDSASDLYTAAAHELGHGQFVLKHPFDKDYGARIPQSDPFNLMSYGKGTQLAKWQWDQMHDPGVVVRVFEGDEDAMWTTDGHYYTVRLVAQMLGLTKNLAIKLGDAAEYPDSHVHSEKNMQEKDTWIVGGLQQRYHALTGGYHGVELAATTYAITKTHTDDESLYYLLHRFGDDFAHFNIDYDKQGLTKGINIEEYINSLDKYINNLIEKRFLIDPNLKTMATPYGNVTVLHKFYEITESGFIRTNYTKNELVYQFVDFLIKGNHDSHFANYISWKDIQEGVLKILPNAIQNNFKMYGGTQVDVLQLLNCFTLGHSSDGSAPDNIIDRRTLYSLYIDNLVDLLSMKYGISDKETKRGVIKKKFEEIIDHVKYSSIDRLDGILAYEFALLNNPSKDIVYFYIPVKYIVKENLSRLGKLYNAAMSDFDEDAKAIKDDTFKYLDKIGAFKTYYINETLKIDIDGVKYWEFKLIKK